jgi:membrane-associated phospholipid phosphatase
MNFERPLRFLRARFSPEGYLGLHLTAGLLVVVAAGWWFGDIAEDMSRDAATRLLDDRITVWFKGHGTTTLTRFWRAVSFFGSVIFLATASTSVAFVLAVRRAFYRLLALTLTVGGGAVVNLTLKHFFHRQRPVFENPLVTLSSFGFPSGHTMGATLFYGVLALVITHSIVSWPGRVFAGCGAAVIIGLIGVSRIYLGAHYFTDVIGAIAVALAWLAFCWTGVETLRRWRLRGK